METATISKTEYDNLLAENVELKSQIQWLMEQLKLSKSRQFAASSEKTAQGDYCQLNLFNEAELTAAPDVPEPELVEIERHYRKRKRSAADRLPEDLPVKEVIHELPESEKVCPCCDGEMHVMGRETRDELELVPATAKIIRHVRQVYSCRNCEKNSEEVPVIKAEIPEPVIKGSFASPKAIAHIMTQKFVMGSPLYRQEQEWNRQGIMLSRQTMSNWLIRATEDWLSPIYEKMCELLRTSEVLHADETTLQVLKEPGKTAQSKSYMWLYRTGSDAKNPTVLYEYQPSRKAEHPLEFLKKFKGYLHTDGYEAYHNLPAGITVVGCFAHVRRKFNDALKIIPENKRIGTAAFQGKHYCDCLFALERKLANLSSQERFSTRKEQVKPLMDEFFEWCKKSDALPKSPVGTAIQYALKQRKYLENVFSDGRLELSNNRAERSIKPFVIDRKNFLFCNTPRGAKASAMMFSIIETAKENGLNPFEYLSQVFRKAPNGATVDELLPWGLS